MYCLRLAVSLHKKIKKDMESIKKRTSIRKYSEREVSDQLLNSLLEEAERTPTMGNLQLYSVVVKIGRASCRERV